MKFSDSNTRMALLGGAAREVYGSSKPIGMLRGSCWHEQSKRRTLPFAPWETCVQTDDSNQIWNDWATDAGFTVAPVQQEALQFACDILRGTGAPLMIEEADRQNTNMQHMEPPPLPHDDPDSYDDSEFQQEIKARAEICFKRGVSLTMTHFGVGQMAKWRTTFHDDVAPLVNASPVATADAITGTPGDIAGAISAWRSAGGGPTLAVPVEFV